MTASPRIFTSVSANSSPLWDKDTVKQRFSACLSQGVGRVHGFGEVEEIWTSSLPAGDEHVARSFKDRRRALLDEATIKEGRTLN